MNISYGFCQCGCGQKAPIAKKTCQKRGHIKGNPVRFIHGHYLTGANNPRWNNGRTITRWSYVLLYTPDHHRADRFGYVLEHILVMEKALKRPILKSETIHHIDGNKQNNSIENLMLFKTSAMHLSYHARLRAFKACGHWDRMICRFCRQWDDLVNMYVHPNQHQAQHRKCYNKYLREHRAKH